MKQLLQDSWWNQLKEEFEKPYYQELREMLKREYAEQTIYPDSRDIFNALHYTSYDDVKVVILGQDPYHGPGQAQGLSFSVKPGVKQPPSLKNIFLELQQDIGCSIPNHGSLVSWATLFSRSASASAALSERRLSANGALTTIEA